MAPSPTKDATASSSPSTASTQPPPNSTHADDDPLFSNARLLHLSGILKVKRGGDGHPWCHYHCLLFDQALYFFENSSLPSFKGCLKLEGTLVVTEETTPMEFSIVLLNSGIIYEFHAESGEVAKGWVTQLREAIQPSTATGTSNSSSSNSSSSAHVASTVPTEEESTLIESLNEKIESLQGQIRLLQLDVVRKDAQLLRLSMHKSDDGANPTGGGSGGSLQTSPRAPVSGRSKASSRSSSQTKLRTGAPDTIDTDVSALLLREYIPVNTGRSTSPSLLTVEELRIAYHEKIVAERLLQEQKRMCVEMSHELAEERARRVKAEFRAVCAELQLKELGRVSPPHPGMAMPSGGGGGGGVSPGRSRSPGLQQPAVHSSSRSMSPQIAVNPPAASRFRSATPPSNASTTSTASATTPSSTAAVPPAPAATTTPSAQVQQQNPTPRSGTTATPEQPAGTAAPSIMLTPPSQAQTRLIVSPSRRTGSPLAPRSASSGLVGRTSSPPRVAGGSGTHSPYTPKGMQRSNSGTRSPPPVMPGSRPTGSTPPRVASNSPAVLTPRGTRSVSGGIRTTSPPRVVSSSSSRGKSPQTATPTSAGSPATTAAPTTGAGSGPTPTLVRPARGSSTPPRYSGGLGSPPSGGSGIGAGGYGGSPSAYSRPIITSSSVVTVPSATSPSPSSLVSLQQRKAMAAGLLKKPGLKSPVRVVPSPSGTGTGTPTRSPGLAGGGTPRVENQAAPQSGGKSEKDGKPMVMIGGPDFPLPLKLQYL